MQFDPTTMQFTTNYTPIILTVVVIAAVVGALIGGIFLERRLARSRKAD